MMNMRTFSVIVCLLMFVTLSHAQTRRINHRSHSGSPATFAFIVEEDHLGWNGAMEPNYEVEPFLQRVRKHYEEIAKQNPDPKAEVPAPNQPPINLPPVDTAPKMAPPSGPIPLQPKSSNKRKSPMSAAADIPSPDFLVQEIVKASKGDAMAPEPPSRSGLWILLGLIAFPVAPGFFLASAWTSRKRRVG